VIRTLLSNVLGAWLGFATIALFVRTVAPKDTAITCGWCGTPVPMEIAARGGIGAVNAEMRNHMHKCENHPLHDAKRELADARAAMKVIHGLTVRRSGDPLDRTAEDRLTAIRDLAGRIALT
jgi:hypothetical protein